MRGSKDVGFCPSSEYKNCPCRGGGGGGGSQLNNLDKKIRIILSRVAGVCLASFTFEQLCGWAIFATFL